MQVYSTLRTNRYMFLAWIDDTHRALFYLRSLAWSAVMSEGA